jgi:hypothetical protein
MSVQRRISKKKNRALVGAELDVLVEGASDESDLAMVGRHAGQAPEIDGVTYLSGGPVLPGEMVRARVTRATDYDLVADVEVDAPRVLAASVKVRPDSLSHQASDGRRVQRTLPMHVER